jgi:hypothetical protein
MIDAETLEISTLIPEFDSEIGMEGVYADYGISKITSFKAGLSVFESAIEASLSIAPNPVKSVALISWQMPEASRVQISIIDCTSKEVFNVADKYYNAGSSSMHINLADLNPGVYFCRMSTPDYSTIRKIVILK